MKSYEQLKSDLEGHSKKMQLAALDDGHFLASYDATEDQIQKIYDDIENTDAVCFLDESVKLVLEKRKDILRKSNQIETESIISNIAGVLYRENKNDFSFDVFQHVKETSYYLLKSKEFWS